MVCYENSVIYKIYCKNKNICDFYIGSTTNSKQRKSKHKYSCHNTDKHKKLYTYIKNNGGWNNFIFEEIEKFSCKSKLELRKREHFWILKLKPKLNIQVPTRTKKEWNKEYKKTEKYKDYQKTYRSLKVVCECGREILKRSLKRHQKTSIHKEKIKNID